MWDIRDTAWEERYSELVQFKSKTGHCIVPQQWSENPGLGHWVLIQRQFRKKGVLSEERIRRLNDIWFVWDTLEAEWEQRFAQILQFKRRFGHCNVPRNYPEAKGLGAWTSTQRQVRLGTRKGSLNEDRIRRLDEIGFVWDTVSATWEERFSGLVQFKSKTGHCNVPRNWPENPSLSHWVTTQRQNRKRGTLNEERLRRLNDIGFAWNIRESGWEQRFAELVEFKTKTGHCNVPLNWPENPSLGLWVTTQRQVRSGHRTG
mgnify:CR=1 FL=1